MTSWDDRSKAAKALSVIRILLAIPIPIGSYFLIFWFSCDTIDRARNNNNPYTPPGNGHLTDSMNPLVRNAMSIPPPGVMGLQMGLSVACSFVWLGWLALIKDGRDWKAPVGWLVALLEFAAAAAGVLPGLIGWYTLEFWGCYQLFYGQDLSNVSENSIGRTTCDVFRGQNVLSLMAGACWTLTGVLNIVSILCFQFDRVFARDEIEMNRIPARGNAARRSDDPPAYRPEDARDWAGMRNLGTRK